MSTIFIWNSVMFYKINKTDNKYVITDEIDNTKSM